MSVKNNTEDYNLSGLRKSYIYVHKISLHNFDSSAPGLRVHTTNYSSSSCQTRHFITITWLIFLSFDSYFVLSTDVTMYLNVEVKIFWLIWAFSLHYNFIIITPYMRRLLPEAEREFFPYAWLYKLYYLTSWNQVSDYHDDILLLNA